MSETQYTVADLENLAREIKEKRTEVDEKKAIYSKANEELDELEGKAIRILKELGKSSYAGELGTITRVQKSRVNLPQTPEDKEAFAAYLRERGDFERLYTFNSNQLNSYYSQEYNLVKENDPIEALNFKIPGIGEPTIHETLQFRSKK